MASATPSEDFDFAEEKKTRKSCVGRQLMRWNPDVDQLLLLIVDHECVKQGIVLPWDDIAKQIVPYLSGEAVKQHLAKVRHFREQAGRQVPEKLDKSARRKTGRLANAGTTTPAKKGRGGKVKQEQADDEDFTPTKGASLLWQGPVKKTKSPKKVGDGSTLKKTPGTGKGGRKMKAEHFGEDDDIIRTPQTSTPTKSGKRGRKAKKETVNDDLGELDDESPLKKQKVDGEQNVIGLRPARKHVNYQEPSFEDDEDVYDAQQNDEDEAYEEEEQPQMIKQENGSSQGSHIYDQPPPVFATVANPKFYQDFSAHGAANYTSQQNSTYNSPYGMRGHGEFAGLPSFGGGQSMFETNPLQMFHGGPQVSFDPAANEHAMANFNHLMSAQGYDVNQQQQLSELPIQSREYDSQTSFQAVAIPIDRDEEEIKYEEKPMAKRKTSPPKDKTQKVPDKKSPKQNTTIGKRKQNGADSSAQKIESEGSGAASGTTMAYYDGTHGDIPIVNDTVFGHQNINNFNFNLANGAGENGLHLDTNFDLGPEVAFTASPEDYIGGENPFMSGGAHAHPTTVYNNGFAPNNQALNGMLSHDSSFASTIRGSQTDEAMPGMDSGSQSLPNMQFGPYDMTDYDGLMQGAGYGNGDILPLDGTGDLFWN